MGGTQRRRDREQESGVDAERLKVGCRKSPDREQTDASRAQDKSGLQGMRSLYLSGQAEANRQHQSYCPDAASDSVEQIPQGVGASSLYGANP